MKFVRTNVTNGREASMKHVVDTLEAAGFLHSHETVRLFYNADY
jgi:hypothetical protein